MTTVIFDSRDLSSLFDNQKKLDDLFDSIFDDDNFFITGTIVAEAANNAATSNVLHSVKPSTELAKTNWLTMAKGNPYLFLIPIAMEIAVIYYVAANLW